MRIAIQNQLLDARDCSEKVSIVQSILPSSSVGCTEPFQLLFYLPSGERSYIMATYHATIIGIHHDSRTISLSQDLQARACPINVSFKDFGPAMIDNIEQYGEVDFEAAAVAHPFIIRNGVKTSERTKNLRARSFKLLSYNDPEDNLACSRRSPARD